MTVSTRPAAESKKMGVVAATFMVAGNMMGSGVFMLPASLATFGSISLVGWLISGSGAIAIALTFARLTNIYPAAGGPYAYSRKAFGDYIGYQANLVYWVADVVGNVSICVAAIGYMSHFAAALKQPFIAAGAEIFVIWLLTYANMLGPRFIGFVQTIATSVKLVPILGVALLGWLWFDPSLFVSSWNVSGESDLSACAGTITLTLWAFLGVESASVSAGVVKNPARNVPIATITGVLLAGSCYVLSSSVIMGMIPNHQLLASSAPFADAVALALGPAAAHIVAACAALGCLGTLGGWLLLASQSARAAAADGLFGKLFCKSNESGTPVTGLLIVAILMTIMVFFTISPAANEQFEKLVSTAVILTLLPYLYSCIAIKVLAFNVLKHNQYLLAVITGFFGALFCIGALISADPAQTRWSLIFVVSSMVFYSAAITRKRELAEGVLHPGGLAPKWIRLATLVATIVILLFTFWLTIMRHGA